MKRHWRFAVILGSIGLSGLLAALSVNENMAKEPDKRKSSHAASVVVNDVWIDGDAKDKVYPNNFVKRYTFKMEKDKRYQIHLSSNNNRAAIRVEDGTGKQIAADFDRHSAATGAAIFLRAVKTEDCQIIATARKINTDGPFTLTIKELIGDEGKPILLKLDKGVVAFSGSLAKEDERYNGKTHKLFLVKFEANKTYQVDHRSDAFDAFLYLEGPDGTLLAEDDDSGGGLNARIVYKATKGGEYRVVATCLGGKQIGAFTFKVQEKK